MDLFFLFSNDKLWQNIYFVVYENGMRKWSPFSNGKLWVQWELTFMCLKTHARAKKIELKYCGRHDTRGMRVSVWSGRTAINVFCIFFVGPTKIVACNRKVTAQNKHMHRIADAIHFIVYAFGFFSLFCLQLFCVHLKQYSKLLWNFIEISFRAKAEKK